MNRLQLYLQLRRLRRLRRRARRRPRSITRRGNIIRFHDYHPERMPDYHGLPTLASPPAPPKQPYRRRAAVLAGAAVLVSCVAWWLQTVALQSVEYTTGVGERRTIPLRDGSTVVMNTRSHLRVRLSGSERDINLIAGEAAFSVARDPNRPFTVRTQRTLVAALGAQFSVYLGKSDTTITVTEGNVRILPRRPVRTSRLPWMQADAVPIAQAARGFAVSAGQQARVPHERNEVAIFEIVSRRMSSAELERQVAWVNGQLAFEGQPLEEVVEQFNRYNWRQLRIIDPALEQLRVGGRFKSTRVDEFVTDLNRAFGIQALFVADSRSHGPVIELRRAQRGPP